MSQAHTPSSSVQAEADLGSSDAVQQAELSESKAEPDSRTEGSTAALPSDTSRHKSDSEVQESESSEEELESGDEDFEAEQQARKARFETLQLKLARSKIELAQVEELVAMKEERHQMIWCLPRRSAPTVFARLNCQMLDCSADVQLKRSFSHVSAQQRISLQQRRACLRDLFRGVALSLLRAADGFDSCQRLGTEGRALTSSCVLQGARDEVQEVPFGLA